MNYKRIYDSIIENRKMNPLPEGEYGENHHIIPKSLGGSDDKDNIVKLSAREHFICHFLLANMFSTGSDKWHKMTNAFIMMKAKSSMQYRYFNNRLYETMKKNFSLHHSLSQSKEGNSNWGTRWIHNLELKQSKKIKKTEKIPDGWKVGRIMNFDKKDINIEEKKIKVERNRLIRKQKEQKRQKTLAEKTFNEYLNGNFTSIRNYSQSKEKTAMYYSWLWSNHINGYEKLFIKCSKNNGSKFIRKRLKVL